MPNAPSRECCVCGAWFAPMTDHHKACSPPCGRKAKWQRESKVRGWMSRGDCLDCRLLGKVCATCKRVLA